MPSVDADVRRWHGSRSHFFGGNKASASMPDSLDGLTSIDSYRKRVLFRCQGTRREGAVGARRVVGAVEVDRRDVAFARARDSEESASPVGFGAVGLVAENDEQFGVVRRRGMKRIRLAVLAPKSTCRMAVSPPRTLESISETEMHQDSVRNAMNGSSLGYLLLSTHHAETRRPRPRRRMAQTAAKRAGSLAEILQSGG